MKKKSTIQARVADTILQKPIEVVLGNRSYKVTPPAIGTLIRVSEMLAEMPELSFDKGKMLSCVMTNARNEKFIPDVCAMLILGAKYADKKRFGIVGQPRLKTLSKRIYLTSSPKEISNAVAEIITSLGVADFFAISTFLQSLTLTKPTKVEKTTEQTPSGQ